MEAPLSAQLGASGCEVSAVVTVARKRQLGYSLRRQIAALDPEEDHEEVARLTLEVLYGDPIAVHAGLLVGFSRQVAVPSHRPRHLPRRRRRDPARCRAAKR